MNKKQIIEILAGRTGIYKAETIADEILALDDWIPPFDTYSRRYFEGLQIHGQTITHWKPLPEPPTKEEDDE